ncbi:hypothetical protein NG798_25520 [Ancylothrix sp. C2]|uniref:hypothetical protein n=1 Tax=Ancylothrix sp. D3o TaxID=2953691 RepID=UPI0021BAD3A7|nr:hypothetical protein [Ancylothrix sp. D3o]MCT7953163.1 hypothetical protein [Ancylothrix sp. D3o]
MTIPTPQSNGLPLGLTGPLVQPASESTRLPPRSICDNRHPISSSNHRLSGSKDIPPTHQPTSIEYSPTDHRPLTTLRDEEWQSRTTNHKNVRFVLPMNNHS